MEPSLGAGAEVSRRAPCDSDGVCDGQVLLRRCEAVGEVRLRMSVTAVTDGDRCPRCRHTASSHRLSFRTPRNLSSSPFLHPWPLAIRSLNSQAAQRPRKQTNAFAAGKKKSLREKKTSRKKVEENRVKQKTGAPLSQAQHSSSTATPTRGSSSSSSFFRRCRRALLPFSLPQQLYFRS
ncbi:uncharacterized protein K452DRAFT_125711 [Aplosporella prunicola CBS 121167]|uniref:Uncharacterized protein n=1 Tax=Aplosporella prunicola CBS 121167 TaxID=1176127 RepID=A0A6A6BPY5_9PEZI|nr:uncharacterized protein K452DRAFT_125711 [Aplosporella prunicola CBS 121167]KAF2145798.1 hypothetical protein K452DRAFT_125711 [Aplosporella prunicola CBS 121167]